MTEHAKAIRQRTVDAGVVWFECEQCGKPWPFPKGSTMARDWTCTICAQRESSDLRAENARLRAQQEWHPIATLPVDGEVDIWFPPHYRMTGYQARNVLPLYPNATYWRYAPSPPEKEQP